MISINLDKTAFDQPFDPVSSQGVMRFAVNTQDQFNSALNGLSPFERMVYTPPTQLAITSGILATPTLALHTVAAESGVTDDLDSIPASNDRFLVLRAAPGHTISINHGRDNIYTLTGGAFVLTGNRIAMLWGRAGVWSLIAMKRPLDNVSATSDPAPSNDNTQNYNAGSVWINTTLNRPWICLNGASGEAVWELIGSWRNGFSIRAADTVLGVGCNATGAGTTTVANDSENTYILHETAATIGAQSRFNTSGGASATLRMAYNSIIEILIRTGSDTSSQRLWFGLRNNSGAVLNDVDVLPASNDFVGFRYSTVAGDTGWRPVLHDGTTQNTGVAIGTVVADTVYKLKIRVDSANLRAFFSVNNGAEQMMSTNFPALSVDFSAFGAVYTQVNAIRSFLLSRCKVNW